MAYPELIFLEKGDKRCFLRQLSAVACLLFLLLWFSFVFFPLIFFMRNSCFLNSVNIPVPCNVY